MLTARQLTITQAPFRGRSVVYIMSRDQRTQDNHALLAAQALAIKQNAALYVLFVLKKIPTRSREHYEFMLEGLRDVSDALFIHTIPFILRVGNPLEEIITFCADVDAGALFFDFSPLTGARSIVKEVAKKFHGPVSVVDTHNIIPAWAVSDKKEFAAHTMRARVYRKLDEFLRSPPSLQNQPYNAVSVASLSFEDAASYVQSIPPSGISIGIQSGEKSAHGHLEQFIASKLVTYAQSRNNIAHDYQSGLSPYLHFGHISSLRIVLDIIDSTQCMPLLLQEPKLAAHGDQPSLTDGMNALFEELIVRKELSDNFCLYTEDYLSLKAAPEWAQQSLAAHAIDMRDFVYDKQDWESAATHDVIWNAAQIELMKSGKMHGYMRMYWAKKVLEWAATPEEAVKTAVYLNDKYSIDGGDPNGYVGILWAIAGLHDRPWFERPIFGKIRYMNASGLRRKFAVDTYIQRADSLKNNRDAAT